MASMHPQSAGEGSPASPGSTDKGVPSPYCSSSELRERTARLNGRELLFSELLQRAEVQGYLEPEYWYAFAGRGCPSGLSMQEWAEQVMEFGD